MLLKTNEIITNMCHFTFIFLHYSKSCIRCAVVVLLLYVHAQQLWSCRDDQLS